MSAGSARSSAPSLAGSAAFRDLGGTPTTDGRRVAAGRLFRADALTDLDTEDRAVIDALGLRLVCDLRGADERRLMPCLPWVQIRPRELHLELTAGLVSSVAPALGRLLRGPDAAAAGAMMRTTYAELPRSAAPLLGQLFDAMLSGDLPVLVHCTAGKDRTGFTVAMILTALGVSLDVIYADYLRGSGRDPLQAGQPSWHMIETILGRHLEPEEARLVHGVHREYLDAAFATIASDWGDAANYLEHTAGLDRPRRTALRETLLT